ncbi:MAG: hypothetical protein L0Y44_15925 [Phycisphaerales bacterium]|nr:hypothetical protein [Phycisphaerales bacterium]MCI0676065.1 hypothetical protein [Phycisphaerales bacterium]
MADDQPIRAFDFKGFSMWVNATDDQTLLDFAPPAAPRSRGNADSVIEGLFFDGVMWGSDESSFAMRYADPVNIPSTRGFDRFDHPSRQFPPYDCFLVGYCGGLGWDGFAARQIDCGLIVADDSGFGARLRNFARLFDVALNARDAFEAAHVLPDAGDQIEHRTMRLEDGSSVAVFSHRGHQSGETKLWVIGSVHDPSVTHVRLAVKSPLRTHLMAASFRERAVDGLRLPSSAGDVRRIYAGLPTTVRFVPTSASTKHSVVDRRP